MYTPQFVYRVAICPGGNLLYIQITSIVLPYIWLPYKRSLMYLEWNSELLLLPNFSIESGPRVKVPRSFGNSSTVFIMEGRLPEESPESERDSPTVTFIDDEGRLAMRVTIQVPSGEIVLSNNLHVSNVDN